MYTRLLKYVTSDQVAYVKVEIIMFMDRIKISKHKWLNVITVYDTILFNYSLKISTSEQIYLKLRRHCSRKFFLQRDWSNSDCWRWKWLEQPQRRTSRWWRSEPSKSFGVERKLKERKTKKQFLLYKESCNFGPTRLLEKAAKFVCKNRKSKCVITDSVNAVTVDFGQKWWNQICLL